MGLHFIHLFENDFYALFPELFLTCTTMLLLMFGVVWSTSKAQGYPILTHTVAWLCVWSLVCAFGFHGFTSCFAASGVGRKFQNHENRKHHKSIFANNEKMKTFKNRKIKMV